MSLEGLNSLIQLESTRLEWSKQTLTNSQQVNQTVQSQGLQTASSKNNLFLQKIDAEYNKEIQEAEVRKIEAKLARARKAQEWAMLTAVVVTGVNLAGNLGDAIFRDGLGLGGGQKLGDIPEKLHVSPISPGCAQAFAGEQKTNPDGSSDTTGKTMYLAGANGNGTETVYSFKKAGQGTAGDFRAATITDSDKKTILGPELYEKLKAANGGNPPSFAQIMAADPKKAELLMADKCHGIARGEAQDFLKAVESNPKMSDIKDSIKEGLKSTGKLDEKGFLGGVGAIGKSLLNVAVQTAKDSMPYFQAYLKAKEKADNLYEELVAAKSKLAAASKKLHAIELSIDKFAGRGA